MEDFEEDVVFEGSSLYEHLESSGFGSEAISAEPVNRYSDSQNMNIQDVTLESDLKASEGTPENCESENTDNDEDVVCRKKYKFSLKKFILGLIRWLLSLNAWQSETKQSLEQFSLNLNEDIFNASVLEEDDSEFVDKFSRAMRDRFVDTESDNFGEYFKHGAIFVVVLGYGIGRAIQINRTGVAGMNTWSMDVVVVCLMVCVLLPSVIKIVAVEKFRHRLKMARKKTLVHLTEVARCFLLLRKTVRLIQETEVIKRGFTLAEVRSSVNPADHKTEGIQSERQCPALREKVFRLARKVMLATKTKANKLLEIYPLQDKLEGGPDYLCMLNLSEYGPCVTEDIGTEELYKTTDGYALAAIKGMVGLCQSHVSEWLRIVSVYCLLRSQENPNEFDQVFPVMDSLHEDLASSVMHLEYSFLLHKSRLHSETEKKPRTQRQGVYKDVSVAVNSLSMHVKAAYYRLERVEDKIEEKVLSSPDAGSLPPELVRDLSSHLDIVRCDLDACQESWHEAVRRVSGKGQASKEKIVTPESSPKPSEENTEPDIPILISGDPPLVEDQVFEAYTDPNEPEDISETQTVLSPEEREKCQKEKEEAVRMLKELKSVITLRAEDTRQREARALSRMKTSQSETTQSETKASDSIESETVQNASATANTMQNPNKSLQADDPSTVLSGETKNTSTDTSLSCQNPHAIISESPQGQEVQESQRQMYTYESEDAEAAGLDMISTNYENGNEASQVFTADGNDSINSDDSIRDNEAQPETLSLKQKLEKIHGSGSSFTSSIASQAAARSQQMATFSVETFGDESD